MSAAVMPSVAAEPAAPVRRPDQILADNVKAAYSACKGCGGELNADAATVQKLVKRLVREHSQHKTFPLSAENAEQALYGPPGSVPKLAGANNPPPDVSFRDADGAEVYRREVKTFSGTATTFAKQFEDYGKKLGYRGELYVQVPAGTDVRALMDALWAKNTSDARLARYADVYVAFHDEGGRRLGLWMMGARGMGVPG
ncbi:hypothetical protein [Symbioplanes lichenis]|uniref:hypothetical protein n=1 Tax=Symbioplanes lichenis TaxID=1629072 RepID=UPI00273A1A0E|nr:hypothetical protein [Actinoplanes lichenis]